MAVTAEEAQRELARRELARRKTASAPAPARQESPGISRAPFAYNPDAYGAIEAAGAMASSALAAIPAGLKGMLTGLAPGGQSAAEGYNSAMQAMTFQPRTPEGQRSLEAVGGAISKVADPIQSVMRDGIERGVDRMASPTSVFDLPGYLLNKAIPPEALKTATETTLLGFPAVTSLRTKAPTNRVKIARAAQEKGYVVTPGSVNPGSGLAEGLGGKLKTQQIASQRNQAVTNSLIKREFGIPNEADLSPELLRSVRRQASADYQALRNTGRVTADSQYRRDLSNAVRQFKGPQKDFPGIKTASDDLFKTVDSLRQESFDAGSAIDIMRHLRERADESFRAGQSQQGSAWRALSDALEDAVERDLGRRGMTQEVAKFRQARQTIAKSYDVEDALKGSDVDAAVLAARQRSGKPFTGDIKAIADFATEFPKLARVLKEAVPNFSPLDLGVMAASAPVTAGLGAISPAMGAAGAVPFLAAAARPALRSAALGPLQRMATAPSFMGNPLGLLTSGALAEDEAN